MAELRAIHRRYKELQMRHNANAKENTVKKKNLREKNRIRTDEKLHPLTRRLELFWCSLLFLERFVQLVALRNEGGAFFLVGFPFLDQGYPNTFITPPIRLGTESNWIVTHKEGQESERYEDEVDSGDGRFERLYRVMRRAKHSTLHHGERE